MSTQKHGDEYVLRFSLWSRLQHALIILFFGLLLVTGKIGRAHV